MEGKVILVTGASSGIGYQTALKLQKDNIVIWASRSIESDDHIKSVLSYRSVCKNLNVGSEQSVMEMMAYINDLYGRLDALINCAGYVDPEGLFSTTLDNWEKTITVNLTGTFLCVKYGGLLMKKTGGKIINIASTAGLTPRPGWSAYAASKSGVINFSSAIAEELSEYNIKVFVIAPGRTATPLRKILAPDEDPRTIMQPETVADMIVFCLRPEADCIEGQPILVRERF